MRGVGRPRITKSHRCVDYTLQPLGKLIVIGFIAIRLLSTSTPSIMTINVAPVLVIASYVAIVIAFNALCSGIPNMCLAAVAKEGPRRLLTGTTYLSQLRFEVTMVLSSLLVVTTTFMIWVGYKENWIAETKSLNLYAIFSAPPCQKRAPCVGNIVLWIPFMQTWGSRLRKSCTFA